MDSGVQIVTGERGRTLSLAGELDIRAGEELLRAFREFLQSSPAKEIEIQELDLTEVESCDAAVLQLFCSAAATARTAGRALEFVNVSENVLQTAAALGLALPGGGGNGAI